MPNLEQLINVQVFVTVNESVDTWLPLYSLTEGEAENCYADHEKAQLLLWHYREYLAADKHQSLRIQKDFYINVLHFFSMDKILKQYFYISNTCMKNK